MSRLRPTLNAAKKKAIVKRVLRLVDGYLSTRDQMELIAWNGGMMTWRELRQHIKGALRLMVKSKRG